MTTTTKKREAMYERIERHGRQLLAIFPDAKESDPVKLCKALRRLESQGAALALRLCNGPEMTEDEDCEATEAIMGRLCRLLGILDCSVPVFINRDPRGYALKIDDEWMRANNADLHRDWGGYGILAPDLSET